MSLELNGFYPGYAKCCKRRKVQSRRSLYAVSMFRQVYSVTIGAETRYHPGTLFIISVGCLGRSARGGYTRLKSTPAEANRRIPR